MANFSDGVRHVATHIQTFTKKTGDARAQFGIYQMTMEPRADRQIIIVSGSRGPLTEKLIGEISQLNLGGDTPADGIRFVLLQAFYLDGGGPEK